MVWQIRLCWLVEDIRSYDPVELYQYYQFAKGHNYLLCSFQTHLSSAVSNVMIFQDWNVLIFIRKVVIGSKCFLERISLF